MISLNEYKNKLVNSYNWPIDNTESEREKRRQLLTKKYSDEYLEQIISDTNSFIKDVLSSETLEYNYFKSKIDDDTTSYIDLNLHGGWKSDTLFIDVTGRIISKFLIQQIFGSDLLIDVKEDEFEDTSDEDILSYYYRYYIYIQGFPSNVSELKKMMLSDEKKLVKRIGVDGDE